METVKLKKYILLLLLAGLVNVEINAESTMDAKEIFLKLNQRLKHDSFDNIKIDFRIVTTIEVEDPETGKVNLQEQYRDISLVRKGELFRKNERFIVDGSHDYNRNQSWNGDFCVSYAEAMQHVREKKGIKNNTKELVFLSEKEKTLHLKNYLFNMFHLRSEMGIDLAFTEFYLEDDNILIAKSSDNKIREEIYLTDIENALYNKIDTYSKGKLILTHFVEDWTKVDGKFLPKKTYMVIDGVKKGPYELKNIEFGPDYNNETFTLKIPYSEKFVIYNRDLHEKCLLSRIDKQLWENGEYINAFYDAYNTRIEEIILEPLEGVEDVTEQVVVAMPKKDKSKAAASDLIIEDGTSKNDKEDIINKPDNIAEIPNHSKAKPLFYTLGGLLLLGIIGFILTLAVKRKQQ